MAEITVPNSTPGSPTNTNDSELIGVDSKQRWLKAWEESMHHKDSSTSRSTVAESSSFLPGEEKVNHVSNYFPSMLNDKGKTTITQVTEYAHRVALLQTSTNGRYVNDSVSVKRIPLAYTQAPMQSPSFAKPPPALAKTTELKVVDGVKRFIPDINFNVIVKGVSVSLVIRDYHSGRSITEQNILDIANHLKTMGLDLKNVKVNGVSLYKSNPKEDI